MFKSEIFIEERRVALDEPTYFIADIAANHDGDLARARDLIHLAAEAGADAAKFQHFKAETIVSDHGFKALGSQLSHQNRWEKSVFDTYQAASLNLSWTTALQKTCRQAGIHFMTSPYDLNLVDSLDPYLPAFKIGSGDITFLQIIEHIAQKGKPILLACGASTMADIERALAAIKKYITEVVLMQCNTNYTGILDNYKYINLNVLSTFKNKFPGLILGLSDHTPGHVSTLGAIALGARVIEKHFTDDTSRTGPDHSFSMTPKTWLEMTQRSRELEQALGDGVKRVEANELETIVLQRRCLRAVKNLSKDKRLTAEHVEALRPAPQGALEPHQINEILGGKLIVRKQRGDAIFPEDIKHA